MRRLGQHFLKNKAAAKKIAAALELKPGELVIEIGPGHGELTREIKNERLRVENGEEIKIIGIEKDGELARTLKTNLDDGDSVEIIQGDALKILPEIISARALKNGGWKLAGNIPYYITGFLLRLIGGLESKPKLCVFTVQKEVAERIAAEPPKMNPHTHKIVGVGMNRLAASVQFWAKPEVLGYIPRKDFAPPSEVDSAIIKLKVSAKGACLSGRQGSARLTKAMAERTSGRKSKKLKIGAENYYKSVRILFAQPRKTILNNLVSNIKYQISKNGAVEREIKNTKEKIVEKLKKVGINPGDRPQNLSIDDIIKISEFLM